MVKLDISKYLSERELSLKKLNLENCLITDIECEYLMILGCTFKNTIFENSFHDVSGVVRNCYFIDCEFHDSFEGNELGFTISDCRFKNCIFKNILFSAFMVQSEVTDCELTDCILKNINIEGDISIGCLEITGGEMEQVILAGNQILGNLLTNVKMKDVNLNGYIVNNDLKNIIFKNTIVKGYIDDNRLSNCDKQGITIIDDRF